MSLEFAQGLEQHKRRLLAAFLELIPALRRAFPEQTIVLRPHPGESHQVYRRLARQCQRVRVLNQGNVVPWLLAAKALLHNGCTTGLEAYLLGVPAIAYLPHWNQGYDGEFQGLPNQLSHQCFGFDELQDLLGQAIGGALGPAASEERRHLANHYLAAQEGPLACERILDVLDEAGYGARQPPAPAAAAFLRGWLWAEAKTGLTKLHMRRPGLNRRAYHDHRFPELPLADLERRVARFGAILKRFGGVRVLPHSRHLFQIRQAEAS